MFAACSVYFLSLSFSLSMYVCLSVCLSLAAGYCSIDDRHLRLCEIRLCTLGLAIAILDFQGRSSSETGGYVPCLLSLSLPLPMSMPVPLHSSRPLTSDLCLTSDSLWAPFPWVHCSLPCAPVSCHLRSAFCTASPCPALPCPGPCSASASATIRPPYCL